jgi:hypothetical protein
MTVSKDLPIIALFCLLAASCDLPPGWGDETGALTIALPGATVPGQNHAAARAVHLPDAITSEMHYYLDFYKSGGSGFTIGPTSNKIHTVKLEPGSWTILATAYYGNTTILAAEEKRPVEIRAGRTASVSFTMKADDFITPEPTTWGIQGIYIGTLDSPPPLSVTMETDTELTDELSSIPGWTNDFFYQWYRIDENGERTDLTAADNFGGPGTVVFSHTVNNSTMEPGTFEYWVEITNAFTYEGITTTNPAAKNIQVAKVEIKEGTLDYSVGATGPGGGTVFYVAPGFIVNGQICHYLEAGTVSGPHKWSSSLDPTGAYGYAIGTGWTNTQTIIGALNGKDTNSAAHIAHAYGGGEDGWFLPSQFELLELYDSGYFGTDTLWASTEGGDTTMACRIRGIDGHPEVSQKTSEIAYVRPIRAFP